MVSKMVHNYKNSERLKTVKDSTIFFSKENNNNNVFRVPWIEHVVVVVSPGKHHELEAILEEFGHTKVGLTLGHSTRHRSIFAGVQELGKCEWTNSFPAQTVI